MPSGLSRGPIWVPFGLRLGAKGFLDTLERGITDGCTVLIENIFEELDAVLGDVIGQNTIKKGRAIMIGDKEVEYNKKFRLILHTKMANPHYKPEIQAQCTLINFTVTQAGATRPIVESPGRRANLG